MSTPVTSPEPRHWLVKFAPFRTSWAEIVRRGTFTLRGVRSPAARANLSSMRLGDSVLFYHSQQELAVKGVLEVTREAYPDPTSSDPRWLTCDFRPLESLARPVSLAEIKAEPALASIALIRQPRLAVIPISPTDFSRILNKSIVAPSASQSTSSIPSTSTASSKTRQELSICPDRTAKPVPAIRP